MIVGTHKSSVSSPEAHDNISHLLYTSILRDSVAFSDIVMNENGIGAKGRTTHMFFAVDSVSSERDPMLSVVMTAIETKLLSLDYVNEMKPGVCLHIGSL